MWCFSKQKSYILWVDIESIEQMFSGQFILYHTLKILGFLAGIISLN